MNNRTLGTLALLGAPFLLIGMILEDRIKTLSGSWFTGFWGLIYITAWMGSIIALQRMNVTGPSLFGRWLLRVVLGTLLLANASNVYQLIAPGHKSATFWVLDTFWPVSNLLMLVVGITVVVAKQLQGWQRYVPLFVGLWLPLALLSLAILGRTPISLWFGSGYSALAWSLLALVVLRPNLNTSARSSSFSLSA